MATRGDARADLVGRAGLEEATEEDATALMEEATAVDATEDDEDSRGGTGKSGLRAREGLAGDTRSD